MATNQIFSNGVHKNDILIVTLYTLVLINDTLGQYDDTFGQHNETNRIDSHYARTEQRYVNIEILRDNTVRRNDNTVRRNVKTVHRYRFYRISITKRLCIDKEKIKQRFVFSSTSRAMKMVATH